MNIKVTLHALPAYNIAHPDASEEEMLVALGEGLPIDRNVALRLVGRRKVHPEGSTSGYVLHRKLTGIFVLVSEEAVPERVVPEEGSYLLVTFLRFYGVTQKELASKLYPELVQDVPANEAPPTAAASEETPKDAPRLMLGEYPVGRIELDPDFCTRLALTSKSQARRVLTEAVRTGELPRASDGNPEVVAHLRGHRIGLYSRGKASWTVRVLDSPNP